MPPGIIREWLRCSQTIQVQIRSTLKLYTLIYYNSMEVRPENSLSTYKVSIFVHSAHRNRAKKHASKMWLRKEQLIWKQKILSKRLSTELQFKCSVAFRTSREPPDCMHSMESLTPHKQLGGFAMSSIFWICTSQLNQKCRVPSYFTRDQEHDCDLAMQCLGSLNNLWNNR